MSTVLLDTTDLGKAEEIISAKFVRVQLFRHPTGGTGRTRISRATVGSLNVDDVEFGHDMDFRSEPLGPLDQIYVTRMRAGVLAYKWAEQEEVVFGPGDVSAYGGGIEGAAFDGRVLHARNDLVSMDRQVLNEVATGPGDAPVRLTGIAPVSPEANRHLLRVVDHVVQSVADDPDIAESPLLINEIQRYLASSMLAVFPNTALLEPTSEDRRDSTPLLLRRAIAFIDDNADKDISLTDIANAVFVTPRALQYMFRRHRDCTPTEYLRQIRLHQAHLDLVAGTRDTVTVGEIARRWGFGHVGRFAVRYREHYGQSPHLTLIS